ncbi:MAG TPA: 2-dehydropantoate 2-reductase [Prolixibacteraceae bacterium]|nr:2-dehydropantoate 2-reductase [Prolixibacteraceae bacterium]HPS12623.1 2-dehydropantoate 2-reductase [Prolixibacteraceae bacterium]
MKISVIGAGGVGGYFGGKLALAGNEVTFIARGAHLEAIRENGLLVKSSTGDFTIEPAKVTSKYEAISGSDLILIGTKAWQIKEIAKQISPFISDSTMIMPLQNGVLAAEELAESIPGRNIIGGLCRIFSMIESPGIIKQTGIDPTIVFGEPDNTSTARIASLTELFTKAGISSIHSKDIQADLWKKFLMICSSGLLAITKTNYGEMRTIPETRKMLAELFSEIYQTGIAAGINLPENIIEKTMNAVDTFPPESTSSLTRDVWAGRASEIEYQNGTVVKLGEKYKVQTPVNRFVYYSILPMEIKARSVNPK